MILTNSNYFSKKANMEYMSVSQFKAFDKCEAAALAETFNISKLEAINVLNECDDDLRRAVSVLKAKSLEDSD